jgi:uncharacterized membrane protein YkgB
MGEHTTIPARTIASISQIHTIGLGLLRYGLALVIAIIGSYKFFEFEVEAIRPLVGSSPLVSWLYEVLGVRGAAAMFGLCEIAIALLIATRPWVPRVSAFASLAASGMFVVTLSFLVTTPGAMMPTNPYQQFLLKDVVLLGAALLISAEALSASHSSGRLKVTGR